MWSNVALALALFAGTVAAAATPAGHAVDIAITAWLQQAAPGPDGTTAMLVLLANAGTFIPALAAIGVVFLVFGWKTPGRGALWLAIGASCVSAVAAVCQNAIRSDGPPFSVKRHFRRPPDAPMQLLHALGLTDVFVVVLAIAALVLLILTERRRDRAVLALGLTGAGLVAVALIFQGLRGTNSLAETLAHLDIAPFGYPSGHVARITLVSWIALRRVPWLAAVPVLSIMLSLVYLGDHWTSQALGGLWLGYAAVEIGAGVWRWLGEGSSEPDV